MIVNKVGYCVDDSKSLKFNVLFCSGRDIYKVSSNEKIPNIIYRHGDSVLSINGISLAKDYSQLAFIEYRFDEHIYSRLCIRDLEEESDITILGEYRALCLNPALSPDGSKIAFIYTNNEGEGFLHLIDVYTRHENVIVSKIVNNDARSFPSWSADGKKILFDTAKGAVAYVELETGNITTIANGELASWYANSNYITYRSKDSNNIFYSKFDKKEENDHVFLNGKKLKLVGSIWSPITWSQNGSFICFYTYKETFWGKPKSYIYIYAINSEEIKSVIELGKITPSGACFLIIQGGNEVKSTFDH